MRERINSALATVEQHMAATDEVTKRDGLTTEQALTIIARKNPDDDATAAESRRRPMSPVSTREGLAERVSACVQSYKVS